MKGVIMRRWMTAGVLAIGVVLGAIGGMALGGPGLAGAADDGADAADAIRHHVTTWVEDALAPLVEDRTLTQDQADAVVQALRDARPERPARGTGHLGDPDLLRERLAGAVEAGRITQDQADRMIERMEARREAIENGDWSPRHEHLRDRMHERMAGTTQT
jgi:hypothetical protein